MTEQSAYTGRYDRIRPAEIVIRGTPTQNMGGLSEEDLAAKMARLCAEEGQHIQRHGWGRSETAISNRAKAEGMSTRKRIFLALTAEWQGTYDLAAAVDREANVIRRNMRTLVEKGLAEQRRNNMGHLQWRLAE